MISVPGNKVSDDKVCPWNTITLLMGRLLFENRALIAAQTISKKKKKKLGKKEVNNNTK